MSDVTHPGWGEELQRAFRDSFTGFVDVSSDSDSRTDAAAPLMAMDVGQLVKLQGDDLSMVSALLSARVGVTSPTSVGAIAFFSGELLRVRISDLKTRSMLPLKGSEADDAKWLMNLAEAEPEFYRDIAVSLCLARTDDEIPNEFLSIPDESADAFGESG